MKILNTWVTGQIGVRYLHYARELSWNRSLKHSKNNKIDHLKSTNSSKSRIKSQPEAEKTQKIQPILNENLK